MSVSELVCWSNTTLIPGKNRQLRAERLITSKKIFTDVKELIKMAETLVVRILWKSVKYLLRVLY